jgi:hypothetical protein
LSRSWVAATFTTTAKLLELIFTTRQPEACASCSSHGRRGDHGAVNVGVTLTGLKGADHPRAIGHGGAAEETGRGAISRLTSPIASPFAT